MPSPSVFVSFYLLAQLLLADPSLANYVSLPVTLRRAEITDILRWLRQYKYKAR